MPMKCLCPFYYIVNTTPTQYNLPYVCATLEDPVWSNRLAWIEHSTWSEYQDKIPLGLLNTNIKASI